MKAIISIFLITVLNSLIIHAQSGNNALNFDGTDDYVSTADIDNSLTAFTIEAWVKWDPSSSSDVNFICGKEVEQMELHTGGGAGANGIRFIPTTGVYLDASNVLPTGRWTHITAVYDPSISLAKMYINGLQVTLTSNGPNPVGTAINNTATVFEIGNRSDGSYRFKGSIDEVRIWSGVRSELQIRQNMYCELSNPAGETNLVSYYKFNENSGTSLADSKGSNTGTLTNMTGNEWFTSPAMFETRNCLKVNGSSNYGTIPANASLQNSVFTVEFWMQMDAPSTTWAGIIDNGRDANRNWYFFPVPGSYTIIFGVGSGSGVAEIWMGIDNSDWHHIAGVFDGTTMYLYLDGVLNQTATATIGTSMRNIIIGKRDGYSQYYNGKLDELRIWSDVRTAAEIRENMFYHLTGQEANLVAYYPFDVNTGTAFPDFSSNRNDGSLSSGSWVTSDAYNVWLSTSSTNWSLASNWSRGSVPGTTDNVGILNYYNEPVINVSPVLTNLYIGSGTSSSLASSLNITRNFIIDQDIDLNGQTITLGSNATLYEYNGSLYGSTGQIQTTRSLSAITAQNVGGLGAIITTAANMGTTTIIRKHSPILGTGISSIKRFYSIAPTTNTGLNATLTFSYRDAELNGNAEANLHLYKSSDAGVHWTDMGGTVNTSNNTILLSSIDGFSWWTAVEAGATLPVELLTFDGKWNNNSIDLSWSTATETNNAGFILYRSSDNLNFSVVAEIEGAGNSNSLKNYQFSDNSVEKGISYFYYLIDKSFDGLENKSYTIAVVPKTDESELISNFYPNPVADNLHIFLNDSKPCEIFVINSLGQIVSSFVSDSDKMNYNIDCSSWPAGMYIIVAKSESGVHTNLLNKVD